jgi:hypothetical protein
MTTFTIDSENTITVFATLEEARANGPADMTFTSEKELAKLTAAWPLGRYADVWNNFAGVVPFADLKPVKKFANRSAAVARIWKAIQALTPAKPESAPRHVTKKALVLDLIRRDGGATLQEIMDATGWEKHSVRGFISGALGKKMGLHVESSKREDGQRAYRLA